MSLFNCEKYFDVILNKKYNNYVEFYRDKKYLIQDIVYEIQKKMDNGDIDLTIYLKPSRYKNLSVPYFLESIPLKCHQGNGVNIGFEYSVDIKIEDLKNIEKTYDETMKETMLSKEDFFKEKKEELMREFDKEVENE